MQSQEQSHGRLISLITGSMRGGFQGGVLASLEGKHRATGGNALRAAVLGANERHGFEHESGDGGCRRLTE